MEMIAIIPARGGSKRIPQKNIRAFSGKPIISYAVEAALEAGIFDEVMVSTDDENIAEVGKKYGAKVPFMRSSATSDDYATTFDVLEEVLNNYKKECISFENICCIYPCVPFLTSMTLKTAFNEFMGVNGLIPVCRYPAPIEWAMKIENGILKPNDLSAQNIRSQDLAPKYFDAGMFYFCKTSALLKYRTLVPDNTKAFIIDEKECQDIDTLDDWTLAELKYSILHKK